MDTVSAVRIAMVFLCSAGVGVLGEDSAQARPRSRSRPRSPRRTARILLRALPPAVPTPQVLTLPPPPQLELNPSFFDEHALRVQLAMMMFGPDIYKLHPTPRATGHLLPTDVPPRSFFESPPQMDDGLRLSQELDWTVIRNPAPSMTAPNVALGMGLFMVTVGAAAHGPRPIRFLFSGPVHLGPAVFDGGGMGAGISGVMPTGSK